MEVEELIKKCIDGDNSAQRELYEQYSEMGRGVCTRFIKDSSIAEDVLQEGFIKIYNNINTYNRSGTLDGWMYRIFVNASINQLKAEKRFRDLKDRSTPTPRMTKPDALSNIGVEEISKLIDELPPGYQTVFNLYVIDGYRHKEIGEILNISENTSKSQLGRARQKLKKQINKLYNTN